MGTRSNICIFSNGEMKLQQYAQWDGYLTGQGRTFIEFVKTKLQQPFNRQFDKAIKDFKEKAAILKNTPQEYIEEIAEFFKTLQLKSEYAIPFNVYGSIFCRETGAEILDIINSLRPFEFGEGRFFPIQLDYKDEMIEFAYIIDLDKKMLYFLTSHDFKGKVKTIPAKVAARFTDNMKCWYKISIQDLPDFETVKRYKDSIELDYYPENDMSY